MSRVLDGRVAVVTGAGRGIGRALALALAEAGADVVLAARTTDELEKVAAEVSERGRRTLVVRYLAAMGQVIEAGLSDASVFVWTLPMFHGAGWGFAWAVTAAGGRHVCLRRVEPAEVWRLLDDEGVTHLNGAPTVHLDLLEHEAARRRDGPGELIAFTRERLAHFKCPDAVCFGPLPKTATGKVQKFLLRERARTRGAGEAA